MIFNEIKCHVNTSLDLVGGCIPCIPPVSAPDADLSENEEDKFPPILCTYTPAVKVDFPCEKKVL